MQEDEHLILSIYFFQVTADATRLRDEIKNLESTIEKCEDDKNTKDSQIRTLRDEIAHQEDMIVKLGEKILLRNKIPALFCVFLQARRRRQLEREDRRLRRTFNLQRIGATTSTR